MDTNQPTLYDNYGLIDLDQMVVCFTLHQAIIEHARYQEEGDGVRVHATFIQFYWFIAGHIRSIFAFIG